MHLAQGPAVWACAPDWDPWAFQTEACNTDKACCSPRTLPALRGDDFPFLHMPKAFPLEFSRQWVSWMNQEMKPTHSDFAQPDVIRPRPRGGTLRRTLCLHWQGFEGSLIRTLPRGEFYLSSTSWITSGFTCVLEENSFTLYFYLGNALTSWPFWR